MDIRLNTALSQSATAGGAVHSQVINAAICVLLLVHYLPLQIIQWCYLKKPDVATYLMDVYVSQVYIYYNRLILQTMTTYIHTSRKAERNCRECKLNF